MIDVSWICRVQSWQDIKHSVKRQIAEDANVNHIWATGDLSERSDRRERSGFNSMLCACMNYSDLFDSLCVPFSMTKSYFSSTGLAA